MAKSWSPADMMRLMVVTTGCLCLATLVICVSYAAVMEKITPELLGSIKGVGVGGGFAGLAMVLYMVIKVALQGEAKE